MATIVMNKPEVLVDVADGVATITLNRPEKLNALNGGMRAALVEAFDRTDADDSVGAVIVTGAGERAFCAGADLTPEQGGVFASADAIDDLSDERVRDGAGLIALRIFRSTKPVIGAINGASIGVGVTMTLPMDFRLASSNAKFGFVFTRRGITPEGASAWFLPRIVSMPTALDWTLTGRTFLADEALAAGLVRSVHAPEDLLPAAHAIAAEIAATTSPVSVAMTRSMMWRLSAADHPMAAHKLDSRAVFTRSKSADAEEGVASFIEKRAPSFPGKVSTDMPSFHAWWDEPNWG